MSGLEDKTLPVTVYSRKVQDDHVDRTNDTTSRLCTATVKWEPPTCMVNANDVPSIPNTFLTPLQKMVSERQYEQSEDVGSGVQPCVVEKWKPPPCPPGVDCRRCTGVKGFNNPCYECGARSVVVQATDTNQRPVHSSLARTDKKLNVTQPKRPMTLLERDEEYILKGKPYINLPADQPVLSLHRAYNYWPYPRNAYINAFGALNGCSDCAKPPCRLACAPESKSARQIREFHHQIQQMEASNRLRDLELMNPAHDIQCLRRKMDLVTTKAQRDVFYDHEGRYQRERVGLYVTSYDPDKLKKTVEASDHNAAELGNITSVSGGTLDHPTPLNDFIAEAVRRSRTTGANSVPQYHEMPTPYEVMRPYKIARELQTRHLLPDSSSANARLQEGHHITMATTYADYNTPLYLEQNFPVAVSARNEPFEMMSSSNGKLNNVRPLCRVPQQLQQFALPTWMEQPLPPPPCCDTRSTSFGTYRSLAAGMYKLNRRACPVELPCRLPSCNAYEVLHDPDSYNLSFRKPRVFVQNPSDPVCRKLLQEQAEDELKVRDDGSQCLFRFEHKRSPPCPKSAKSGVMPDRIVGSQIACLGASTIAPT